MKKILITGSNGLLGQKLVGLLRSNNTFQVVATSRGKNRLPYTEGYTYRSMDICDKEVIDSVFEEQNPDIVIHTAGMTLVDECEQQKETCWQQNVEALEKLCEACKKQDIFLIHLSTDFIFDGKAGPYREDDEANPISFYGWSKYAAEKMVQTSGIRWAIARTELVFGIAHDMSRTNLILWTKKSLEEGKIIKVVTDQWRTPTLAEDLAIGCMLIAEKETQGVFNISGKDFLTAYEMAIETADFFGLDKNLIEKADADSFKQIAKRPSRTGFYLYKANEILNYQPRSFKEGIAILAQQIS